MIYVPIFESRRLTGERTTHIPQKRFVLTPAFQLALTSGAVACAMHTIESVSQVAFQAALELDFSRGFMVAHRQVHACLQG